MQLNKISKECLDLFTKNMCYTESIEVLIKQIVNENEATAEYCLKLLLDLINFTELNQLENFCAILCSDLGSSRRGKLSLPPQIFSI